MSDHPILFSAPMIRALLEGRKTQTRRIYKGRNAFWKGDRIWVREAHRFIANTGSHRSDGAYQYRADEAVKYGEMIQGAEWVSRNGEPKDAWRPSIHMPRYVSRLTLIVTQAMVNVSLHSISEEDARAEGVERPILPLYPTRPFRSAFFGLWNDLHGEGSWQRNPYVSAYTFTVEKGNIDEVR